MRNFSYMAISKKTIDHIIQYLRLGTVTCEAQTKELNKFRKRLPTGKVFKNGKKQEKYKYECQICKKWFDIKDIERDHIMEIGSFNGDWNEYIRRMYDFEGNLNPLCIPCHQRKTTRNASLRFQRKTNRDLL